MGIVDTLQYPEFTRVGVMLFNNTMQFHRITPTGDIAEVVVGDLADGFCPDPYDKITFNI